MREKALEMICKHDRLALLGDQSKGFIIDLMVEFWEQNKVVSVEFGDINVAMNEAIRKAVSEATINIDTQVTDAESEKVLEGIYKSEADAFYSAALALFKAPHYDHFATRLNSDEMEAVDTLRGLVEVRLGHGVYDQESKEQEQEKKKHFVPNLSGHGLGIREQLKASRLSYDVSVVNDIEEDFKALRRLNSSGLDIGFRDHLNIIKVRLMRHINEANGFVEV